jgi:hypothetical protein
MNPAGRLYSVFKKLATQAKDRPMVDVWAAVFAIPTGPHQEDDVTACLVALRAELAMTRQVLSSIGVPDQLTSPGLERLKDVASPGLLRSGWQTHRGNVLAPECKKVFEWAEWVLRDQSEPRICPRTR